MIENEENKSNFIHKIKSLFMFNRGKILGDGKENNEKGVLQGLIQTLGPNDDVDIDVYKEFLDKALKDDKILNIALSGAYGSGKTSILKTYEKKLTEANKSSADKNWFEKIINKLKKEKKKYKFLYVSLAHFDETDVTETKNASDNQVSRESAIEWKILNQIIHKIDNGKIPLSSIKKIEEDSSLWWWAFLPSVFSFLSYFLFCFIMPKNIMTINLCCLIGASILWCLWLFMLILFVHRIIWFQKQIKLGS